MPLPVVAIGLIKAAPFIANILSKLIGVKPRGDFQVFHRKAYPMMFQQAKLGGYPADAFWFGGDIVRVFPDGTFQVIHNSATLAGAYEFWNNLARTESFYVLDCGSTGIESPDCHFLDYGSGGTARDSGGGLMEIVGGGSSNSAGVSSGGGGGLGLVASLGGLALLAWKVLK